LPRLWRVEDGIDAPGARCLVPQAAQLLGEGKIFRSLQALQVATSVAQAVLQKSGGLKPKRKTSSVAGSARCGLAPIVTHFGKWVTPPVMPCLTAKAVDRTTGEGRCPSTRAFGDK